MRINVKYYDSTLFFEKFFKEKAIEIESKLRLFEIEKEVLFLDTFEFAQKLFKVVPKGANERIDTIASDFAVS